ncbi:hypothetical protein [Staphylococcus phage vB_SauM-V1SA19]|nr:hypothetical protein [Staphylococcus phage vB_SauM-V1SA19]
MMKVLKKGYVEKGIKFFINFRLRSPRDDG